MPAAYTIDQLIAVRRQLDPGVTLLLSDDVAFVKELSAADRVHFLEEFGEALLESLRSEDPSSASFLLNAYQAASNPSNPLFSGDYADATNRTLEGRLAKR